MMRKKYSIGLSTDISCGEYRKLLERFGEYIDYVYFSIPISDRFQSRKNLYSKYSRNEATDFLSHVIELFRKFDIKIELALNTYRLSEQDLEDACHYLENELHEMPDAVVSNCKDINRIYELFPRAYHIVSFNSAVRTEKDLEKVPDCYNEIVVGSSGIRNEQFWKAIHAKGFQCRLLLNNGCSFNCHSCMRAELCKKTFEHNLQSVPINYLYALQSLYPSEVKKYIENNRYVDSYKISNRNCSYDYLEKCLSGYIEGNDHTDAGDRHFYYWARMSCFGEHKNELREDEIQMFKEKIWRGHL